MAERLECVEIFNDGDRFVAYGRNADVRTVYRRAVDDSWHRATRHTKYPSCLKFMVGATLRIRGKLTREEIKERYGERLTLRQRPPVAS